eukprot:1676747-Amphidinium_carterae.1
MMTGWHRVWVVVSPASLGSGACDLDVVVALLVKGCVVLVVTMSSSLLFAVVHVVAELVVLILT